MPREFDPIAASAKAALRSTERSLREVERSTSLPKLPAHRQMSKEAKNAIDTVAQFSPFNVFGRDDTPDVPTPGNGADALPAVADVGIPSPQSVLPEGLPTPQQLLPEQLVPSQDTGRDNGNGNGNGDNGNGNGNGDNGNGNGRSVSGRGQTSGRGRGQSR